ncbi:AI-2E family transporter [Roseomonas marmotae]|uniref:AI-2E family transporter n=1 Tax=Roseomonas marmotae TaxID=2768161 RepID=A0ABS3KJQ1_9PROT|nr:AI-2E family transporter [Roseomonas marmotae]MBO1076566.1 AI-2E family transporter [Roseomonas marmotae]QTI79554.1 AI-2E family transporter [Roseomonas marmotae]
MRRRPVSVITFALILVLLVWQVPDALLLTFAGVLLGVFLRGGGDLLFQRFGFSGMARVLLFALLLLLGVGFALLAAPQLAEQASQLWQQLPRALAQITERLSRYSWGQQLLERAKPENLQLPSGGGSSAFALLGGTFGALGNAVLLIFLGLYFAVDPGLYRRGIELFFPPSLRPKARATCEEVAGTLRGWLGAQFISMAVVGVLTTLGLWALGIPLALLLGMIAALLTFIPNIGPVIAAVPAVLLGLDSGATGAFSVIGLYLAVQSVESYLITPYVQKRSVDLPPALTIMAQVAMGTLFGIMGLALATPLAAVGMMLVHRLYVEDYLEQERPEETPVVLR